MDRGAAQGIPLEYNSVWRLQPTAEYEKRVRRWPKRHRRELTAMLNNLDTLIGAQNGGAAIEQARFGFIHPEPHGVLAIDQKGGGAGLKQTRLYLYPENDTEILHLITIGDKSSQKSDIALCSNFVKTLFAERQD
jgi:hypothetical protein